MSDSMLHPTSDRLEAFAEGTVPDGDRAVLESHVLSCGRCQAEIEEWRALFTALATLPKFEPTPGFADRVLAGVRIRVPWYAPVLALLGRLLPSTTMGWALVVGLLGLPVVVSAAGLAWLLSHPGVTPEGLLYMLTTRGGALLATAGGALGSFILQNAATLWLAEGLESVRGGGARQLGAFATVFVSIAAASIYVLYKNLFRPDSREMPYVSITL